MALSSSEHSSSLPATQTRLQPVRLAFGITIFLSAFLLFLVQPLISKIILPWFGGSTGVWATCMVFFQAMLCFGYGYAHFIQRLTLAKQRWCHWGLLGLGLLCLPVMPGEMWKPEDGNYPTFRILAILLLKTGLPYLALSATGPLLQAWHARLFPESRTYRLYALSNVASLLSLLLFPLWFERSMTLNMLSHVWSVAFVLFAACCGYVAYSVARSQFAFGNRWQDNPSAMTTKDVSMRPSNYLLWLLLPAFASFLLVGGTSHLCQDIASTPFLWILPLCLYLLSFILAFDAPHWYIRRVYVVMGLIGVYGVIAMRELDDTEKLNQGWLANGSIPIFAPLWQALEWYTPEVSATSTWADWLQHQVSRANFQIDLVGQIAMHCVALFAAFMVCHGELAKRKPPASYLTAFYLMISIGGALGSAFVSFVAPVFFKGIWEWWFGLAACVAIFFVLLFQGALDRDPMSRMRRYFWFALPTLAIVGFTVWQSSKVPLSLAERLGGNPLPASVNLDFDSDSDATNLFEDTDLSSAWTGIEGERLMSATTGYVLLTCVVVLLVVGLVASFVHGNLASWLNWTVINGAALGLGCLFVRDSISFTAPELLEEPTLLSDLVNDDNTVWRDRNFYGALTIEESSNLRELHHGRIIHGSQHIDGPERSQPTTYYTENSGVAIAIRHVWNRPNVHIGAIGLGTGTLASFVAPTWKSTAESTIDSPHYRFTVYEINPLVVSLSEGEDPWFCYLEDAKARGADVRIVMGDARLMMERQEAQAFDVLAVDAFSGDSIPVHLLTDEAMTIYKRHLRTDGVLAIHISNRYLDLEPVCKALAKNHGYEARVIDDDTGEDGYSSTWVLLTLDASLYGQLDDAADNSRPTSIKAAIAWTDDFSSLYEVLFNQKFDNAIASIEATQWFQSQAQLHPGIEIRMVTHWFRDGWTYCETKDGSNSDAKYGVRVRDSSVEISDGSESTPTWKRVH